MARRVPSVDPSFAMTISIAMPPRSHGGHPLEDFLDGLLFVVDGNDDG